MPLASAHQLGREQLEEQLRQADEYVARTEWYAERQRRLVADMERNGQNVEAERRVLAAIEALLTADAADRERLRTMVAD